MKILPSSKRSFKNCSILLSATFLFLVPSARTIETNAKAIINFIYANPPLSYVASFALALLLMLIAIRMIRRIILNSTRFNLIQSLAILGLGALVISLNPLPIETMHVLQYGYLAFCSIQSFCYSANPTGKHIVYGVLLSQVVSIGDELLQGLHPERYFDVRDLLFNCLGALIGAALARRDSIKKESLR